ncbi:intradiol ring-cleavage dioxygenase [Nocardioides sp. KIGAM211]|uniref:Intradiol ring-cleavage dioxygenase n=1 Tax=Nocardioides luti TaxID=2761101 RepID=A0A7X0RJJ9_9ACTN|nr:intradiol ring-cleavage dioxygenase [Nocardioides luti]MBB6629327.1 intradiol ring-cleavage dioxygenase [Nocardioides luti]
MPQRPATPPTPDHRQPHGHAHGHGDELEDHDLGLSHDLPRIVERNRLGRRGVLGIFGGLGVAAVAGCGLTDSTSTKTIATGTASSAAGDRPGAPPAGGGGGDTAAVDVADGEIPEETAGPYPGDGSNGVNVLTESGIVRSDITSSFGDASGVAEGVPVTIRLKVYDLNGEDATALAGAAVYLWHCDREGNYSMYSEAVADENYLRGVQETDEQGRVEFTSIFPACYAGRWPHMHFEVYQSVADATSYSNKLRTSQLALPQDVCEDVYATTGYEQSVTNLSQISLDSDGIFSDGYSLQMAAVTGSTDAGYTISLNVPV